MERMRDIRRASHRNLVNRNLLTIYQLNKFVGIELVWNRLMSVSQSVSKSVKSAVPAS